MRKPSGNMRYEHVGKRSVPEKLVMVSMADEFSCSIPSTKSIPVASRPVVVRVRDLPRRDIPCKQVSAAGPAACREFPRWCRQGLTLLAVRRICP